MSHSFMVKEVFLCCAASVELVVADGFHGAWSVNAERHGVFVGVSVWLASIGGVEYLLVVEYGVKRYCRFAGGQLAADIYCFVGIDNVLHYFVETRLNNVAGVGPAFSVPLSDRLVF